MANDMMRKIKQFWRGLDEGQRVAAVFAAALALILLLSVLRGCAEAAEPLVIRGTAVVCEGEPVFIPGLTVTVYDGMAALVSAPGLAEPIAAGWDGAPFGGTLNILGLDASRQRTFDSWLPSGGDIALCGYVAPIPPEACPDIASLNQLLVDQSIALGEARREALSLAEDLRLVCAEAVAAGVDLAHCR